MAHAGSPPSGLLKLNLGLLAVTYVLLVFGASVRVHGAGLACPDWPLCFGEVIPPIDFGVALEFGHRVLAGLVSLGFLALATGIFRARAALGRGIVSLAAWGLLVLVLQVVLGGLTVLELLAEWTVTSHLLAGNTFCLTLLLIALRLREVGAPRRRAPTGLGTRGVAALLVALVPTQLALGGLVSSSHAGLVCGTWPTCDGNTWFPTFEGLVGLQVTHRVVAYLLLGAAFLAFAVVRSRPAAAVLVVVLGQAALGVANVLLHLPVEVTLAHTAGAAAVVLTTTWFVHEVLMAPLPAVDAVPLARPESA